MACSEASDEDVRVSCLNALEQALLAYDDAAGIPPHLFKQLVSRIQALFEEDGAKAEHISRLQAELEDVRGTLEAASRVIEGLQLRTEQQQREQQQPQHHAHATSGTSALPAASSSSQQADSRSSVTCSFAANTSTEGDGLQGQSQQTDQAMTQAELYENLAVLQEERQRLRVQVDALERQAAAKSSEGREQLGQLSSSHQVLRTALEDAQQRLKESIEEHGREVRQWKNAAEHAASVAEAARAQAEQCKAELSRMHALVEAHERDNKHCTASLLAARRELEDACALLDKREEAKGAVDKRIVQPLIACYASTLYPEEQQRAKQLSQAASPAPLPSTPAKACGRPALGPGLRAPRPRGSASCTASSHTHAAASCTSAAPPNAAHSTQDTGTHCALPAPVPLHPLPARSRGFRTLAEQAGAVLGPAAVAEVDSAADRRVDAAAAAVQLLLERLASLGELREGVQAQLHAASERYQRMEAGLQHKRSAALAQLQGELKASMLAHAEAQRQAASLQAELSTTHRDTAAAVAHATQLRSEGDALREQLRQRAAAADALSKEHAAQIRAAAEEAHDLRVQVLDAKNSAQATLEQAHKQQAAAAARLQESLAASAREHATTLLQEQEHSQDRMDRERQKFAAALKEAHHAHARQASETQAELSSKLEAAETRLQDAEAASHRAQAQLQKQVQGLEAELRREQLRAQRLEVELTERKASMLSLEKEREDGVLALASLQASAQQQEEAVQGLQARLLQAGKERDSLEAALDRAYHQIRQLESAYQEQGVQMTTLSQERDGLDATLHAEMDKYKERFARLGEAQKSLSTQLQQRSQRDAAEASRLSLLQQEFSRVTADRASKASCVESLQAKLIQLQDMLAQTEHAAERAWRERELAHEVVDQLRRVTEALQHQLAEQQAQHHTQRTSLEASMRAQQLETEQKLAQLHARQQELKCALLKSGR